MMRNEAESWKKWPGHQQPRRVVRHTAEEIMRELLKINAELGQELADSQGEPVEVDGVVFYPRLNS